MESNGARRFFDLATDEGVDSAMPLIANHAVDILRYCGIDALNKGGVADPSDKSGSGFDLNVDQIGDPVLFFVSVAEAVHDISAYSPKVNFSHDVTQIFNALNSVGDQKPLSNPSLEAKI
jgi:hypothetical protein